MGQNRLRNTKVYQIGPMDNCPLGGVDWRREMYPFLHSLDVTILDPSNKPTDDGIEDFAVRAEINKMKEEGRFSEIREKFKQIREIDLRMCDICDWAIAKVDSSIHMCGSYEEIVTCNRAKKPVVVWSPTGRKTLPNWIFFMLPPELLFDSLEAAKAYITHIDSAEGIDTLNRWRFFNSH